MFYAIWAILRGLFINIFPLPVKKILSFPFCVNLPFFWSPTKRIGNSWPLIDDILSYVREEGLIARGIATKIVCHTYGIFELVAACQWAFLAHCWSEFIDHCVCVCYACPMGVLLCGAGWCRAGGPAQSIDWRRLGVGSRIGEGGILRERASGGLLWRITSLSLFLSVSHTSFIDIPHPSGDLAHTRTHTHLLSSLLTTLLYQYTRVYTFWLKTCLYETVC